MKTFEEVFEKVRNSAPGRIAVAAAADEPVLEAVREAVELGLAKADLVGDREEILKAARKAGLDTALVNIIHEPELQAAAQTAVRLVREGKAKVLMKGLIPTADFLRAVLNKEAGLRTGRLLSSVMVAEISGYDRFILMTDGGIVLYPTLEEKVRLLENVLTVCRALEIDTPKVAAVCAVEAVNPAMQATLDGAALAVMSRRGQIKGMIVDGPLAMDNALSMEAARHKGIDSPVAGQADVLLMPDIEAGNIMYKTMVYTGKAETSTLIMGAAAPIVMTSRADSPRTKLNSIAVALLAG